MRGFVVSMDTIFECELTLQDDGSVKVYRGPGSYHSQLLGSIFSATDWFSTKDAAYMRLEKFMERQMRECQQRIDELDDAFATADKVFYEGLRDQCKESLGKIRNMDPGFLRRM